MLSKICSNAGRYSHTSGVHGKTHQAQRLINMLGNQNSKLTWLTQNCLADLKEVKLNPSLWITMCEIEDKYREDIHEELTTYDYRHTSDACLPSPDNSPAAYGRALAFQVACGLSITPKFLMHYTVTASDMTLEAAIIPKHKSDLIESIHDNLPGLKYSDQMALASAVQPEVLMKIGLPVSKEAMNLSIANKNAGRPQLNEDQLLAMVDYCNSDTKMFNAVNDSMRIWQISGVDKLASITSCLRQPLYEAFRILSQHEAFVYRGPLYKGINLRNPAGPFRLSGMQPGMEYTSPHWSSATQFEDENYSLTKQDRQVQMTICNAEGVLTHVFNDVASRHEGEVIMPPKPLCFLNESEIPQNKKNSQKNFPTIYCTMKPDQSAADCRYKEPHAVRV